MLSCELILQEGDPSNNKHEDVVQTIHASAGLMHNLVDDLLQMVKNFLGIFIRKKLLGPFGCYFR